MVNGRRLISALTLALCGEAWAGTDASGDAAQVSVMRTDPAAPAAGAVLPEVRVSSHYETGLGQTPAASAGTVDGQIFADTALLRPGEALETVPGLVVMQHSGDGKANQYFLRGYNLDHGTDFATSLDGVPVNMPTHAHGQGYSDLNYLIPELVDTIDYRKGPYFAGHGDFSAAGSADIHYANRLDSNFMQATLGTFNYRRLLVAGSTTLGRQSGAPGDDADGPVLLGAIESLGEDGPWTTPEGLGKINGLVRLSDGSRASGWSLDGNLYQAHWNSTDQVPLPLFQSGQLGTYSALDPTDGGESSRAILSGEWHDADASGYRRLSAFVQHAHLQLWSDFTFYAYRNPLLGCARIASNLGIGSFNLPGFSPGDCPLAPNANSPTDQFSQFENRNTVGTQLVRGWKHALWGKDSVTEFGVQARHDDIDVGLLDTQSRQTFYTVSRDQVSETATGLYAQNATTWTPWLRTLLGARYDQVDMDMNSEVITQNSGHASQGILSPKFSAVFGPWERTELFVNLGSGFHSNDARGVIGRIDSTTGQAASPVPALVSSFGREIGVRSEALPGLQTSLSVWSLDSASELIYNADSDIGSTSPNGASTRYGVEWNNHWAYGHWLLLDADFAWTHARYANMDDNGQAGDMIPNAVSQVTVLRATAYRLGPWTLGWETRFIGAYPLTQDGSLMAPSATVSNMRLQYALSRQVDLALDVLNVFGALYDDIAYGQDYQTSASGVYEPNGVTVHPGEPQQLRVTMRMRF